MISYEPLWETMKNKGITKYALTQKFSVSKPTISRLQKNMTVTTETIDKLCEILECEVEEIMKHTPEE